MTAEAAMKLLDNEWMLLLFRDGLGSYSCLAVKIKEEGEDPDINNALTDWRDYDSPITEKSCGIFSGPNRLCGCGITPSEAIKVCVEKVLFCRLPID